MSPVLTAHARGMANGINILIVPYAVPVANEISAPNMKIREGTIHAGMVLLKTPTR